MTRPQLDVGAVLLFKGPRGRFRYEPRSKKAIGMLAGGSGITPMFQVGGRPLAAAALVHGSWLFRGGRAAEPSRPCSRRAGGCSAGAWSRLGAGWQAQQRTKGGAWQPLAAPAPARPSAVRRLLRPRALPRCPQVAQELVRDPNDDTSVSLVYANVTGA